MPKYGDGYYTKFVAMAHDLGSGLDLKGRFDGALKALGALLKKDSTVNQVVAAIAALDNVKDAVHTSKQLKYREAIAFLENTFPIPLNQRVSAVGAGVEAIRYLRNPVRPTANFNQGNIDFKSLSLSKSTAQFGLAMTVPEFISKHAANTRLVLIHLGGHQLDMNSIWDGKTALEHMNLVLDAAIEHSLHVCILRDPHTAGRGVSVPSPANGVCDGLRDRVGRIAGTHVWVADGGAAHSAFHDAAYEAWVSVAGVNTVVVMGFDADICVRGNVFGISEAALNANPPRVVPALINFVDVVTARPLLSGGDAGTVQQMDYWGNLAFMKTD